jgi:predicted phosphodiesterase
MAAARRRHIGQRTDREVVARIVTMLGGTPRPPILQITRETGVTRNTVRRIRDDVDAGRDPYPSVAPSAPKLGGEIKDRKIVALQDEVKRLAQALKDAHRQSSAEEAIERIVGGLAAQPPNPPDWLIQEAGSGRQETVERGTRDRDRKAEKGKRKTPEVPVAMLCDWHVGETVSLSETNGINRYDGEIAGNRVRRIVGGIIDIARNHGPGLYPGIVLNLAGDFVSGAIHPELEKTDEEEVIPSALRALDLLDWAVAAIAAEFGSVYVPCVAGNHGRTTKRPEAKRYVYKNFDWLIYRLLAHRHRNNPKIHFDIPDANEVLYRVFGQRYLLMHGDMLGVKGGDGIIGALGPIARGETKVGKQAAAIGRDYDVLLIGHWHQPLWLQRVIVANALKGFDEYAHRFLRAPPSQPSQPLWFVHPRRGITSRWDVTAEEPRTAAAEPWVSFFPSPSDRKVA